MSGSRCIIATGIACFAMSTSASASADNPWRPNATAPERSTPPQPAAHRDSGLLGPLRVGPMIGISVPDGLGVGMNAKHRLFGFGLFASYLPSVSLPGVNARLTRVSLGADIRIYPFGGAFFFGAGLSYAQMNGSAERSVRVYRQSQTAVGNVFASGGLIGPEVGFLWSVRLSSRPSAPQLSFGTDVGVGFPFGASEPRYSVTKFGLTSDIEGQGKLADAVRFVQTHPTPVVNLLRVGVLL